VVLSDFKFKQRNRVVRKLINRQSDNGNWSRSIVDDDRASEEAAATARATARARARARTARTAAAAAAAVQQHGGRSSATGS